MALGKILSTFPKYQRQKNFFEVSVLVSKEFAIEKNQDSYEPFSKNPDAYQWLIDLWEQA